MKITDDRILDGLDYLCCQKEICIGAYDLINRQKAEIERLQKKANTPFAKVTFDRDKLQEMVDECAKNIEIDINLAKSEAIKEFVERFNSLLAEFADYDTLHIYEIKDRIDLIKEMTESQ